jgi:hypothetical protein
MVELPGGYQWIRHDGESQVVTSGGDIVFDHVTEARGDGALVRGKRENGDSFTIDVRTGTVREMMEGSPI